MPDNEIEKPSRSMLTKRLLSLASLCLSTVGCGELPATEGFNSSLNSRYLYVASGSCYAGGAAVSTGNATIAKFDLETGAYAGTVFDYNKLGNGDQPASIVNFDDSKILVAVENAAGRRIDILARDGTSFTTYISNSTALSGVLRHIAVLSDFSILITKATAIEKFSVARTRVTQGANPFINAPAAPCATATTAMTSTTVLPTGNIVFTHAAATPNNRFGVISSSGYAIAGNCLSGQAGPTTTSLPTASLYDETLGKLLIAYGSATTASNHVYSYNINTTTGAISAATAAWTDNAVVLGPSHMIQDRETRAIFIANGSSGLNNVQKFNMTSSGTLVKTAAAPFIPTNVYTRCITSMEIGP